MGRLLALGLAMLLILSNGATAAEPFMPQRGPVQDWATELFALVMEAHLWYLASLGPFETCEGDNRWLGAPWTVPRPDGLRCAYYSLYWSQRRRLWIIYNALSHLVRCETLDVWAFQVPDLYHPLSCEQLQRDFGRFTGR
jgi:hypothetical protein